MKKIQFILIILLSLSGFSQSKYLTKTGIISFEASVPAFEEIKANNTSTTAILNAANGEFAALVFVKAFRFKNALMEEHFNENYAESDAYPKAKFKGKFSNFDIKAISSKSINYSGSLEFHGKTKVLEKQTMSISKNDDGDIILEGEFSVNVDDFGIEIPKVVSNKLSKTVDVKFSFLLKKR